MRVIYDYKKLKEFMPKVNLNFSGSSPPDLFVGRFNYPNVYAGILSPAVHSEDSYKLSSPEEWFKDRLSIKEILENRGVMIYSRFTTNIKAEDNKLLKVMKEVSMASKPCDVEFVLKKKPVFKLNLDSVMPPIGNPAPLIKAKLRENPKIERGVEYAVSDYELKAKDALINLYKNNFKISDIIKLLSAGLLGIKKNRKLVPSRWAVTAVDSTVSNELLKEIKSLPLINEYMLFNDEYLGNHYEIILMPGEWSFEVIEFNENKEFWHDYEFYEGKKEYASNVTGAYYANRLAVAEYLKKIKRQASAIILREVRGEYNVPLGVGILREVTRSALKRKGEEFKDIKDLFEEAEKRLRLNINLFLEKSILLKKRIRQKRMFDYL